MERATLAPRKRDEKAPDTKVVRVHANLASKAKVIAASRGVDIADYLSEILRTRVLKDWSDMVKDMNRE
jgi:hypothetical protein